MDTTPNKPSKNKFQRPRGTYDILPKDFKYFDKILTVCQKQAHFYGFKRIETPIFENIDIFNRGVGEATDIVEKQMFILKNGAQGLALRPEATASIVRAYIENGMTNLSRPVKLWAFGPFFRHEKPQAGRFRQFWQIDFETIGRNSPVIDAQIIQFFFSLLTRLGLKKLVVGLNSIGCAKCHSRYLKILKLFLRSRQTNLCPNCKRRLKTNPLRILDCKKEKCQEIVATAPQILDSLCKKCRANFKEVLELLDSLNIPYRLDPFLVRGLDYYNRTVFEIFLDQEKDGQKSQIALVGGGRYDNLISALGGIPTPACGGAAGVERIINVLKEQEIVPPEEKKPNVFLAQLGETAKPRALNLFEEFRKANILIAEDFSRDSLKAQLGRADRLGIKYVLILGQKEVIENQIILRNMETKEQKTLKLDQIIKEIKKILNK